MMVWIWSGIFIGALLLELVTPSALICIWFAIGAAGAYLAAWVKLHFWLQLAVFFGVSLIFVFITRPLSKKLMRGNTVATNADRVLQEKALVTKDISEHEWGKVKVLGNEWHAVSMDKEPIQAGDVVRVIAIDGAKLIVKKI